MVQRTDKTTSLAIVPLILALLSQSPDRRGRVDGAISPAMVWDEGAASSGIVAVWNTRQLRAR